MSGDKFQVDRVGLELDGRRYGGHAADLRGAIERLQTAHTSAGPCWGNDSMGREFAAKYQPMTVDIFTWMASAAQVFDAMHRKTVSTSNAYGATDKAVEDALNKVMPEVPKK